MADARALAAALALGLLAAPPVLAQDPTASAAGRLAAIAPGRLDLPAVDLGHFMLSHDGSPAHWLGETIEGRALREPINLVIIDRVSTDPAAASALIGKALAEAGFPARFGHSGGYRALIGGRVHEQLPGERDHAFSDGGFELGNDHGRLFGPFAVEGGYLFTGAFSREAVDPLADPGHRYASFNAARDRVAGALHKGALLELAGFGALGNALVGSAELTTGDHDGVAAVLVTEASR